MNSFWAFLVYNLWTSLTLSPIKSLSPYHHKRDTAIWLEKVFERVNFNVVFFWKVHLFSKISPVMMTEFTRHERLSCIFIYLSKLMLTLGIKDTMKAYFW